VRALAAEFDSSDNIVRVRIIKKSWKHFTGIQSARLVRERIKN
jgi:hypothetical protein